MLISTQERKRIGFKVLSDSFYTKLSTIPGIESCCAELEQILLDCRKRSDPDIGEAQFTRDVEHDLRKCNLLWLKLRFEQIGDVPTPIEFKQLCLELALDELPNFRP